MSSAVAAVDAVGGPAAAVRLRRVPAGPARGGRCGDGRPRRARGDADRLGQVALLPAAGAALRRRHAGRLAADRAHGGSVRGAAQPRPRGRRDADVEHVARTPSTRRSHRIGDGEARLVYVAPERFSSRRFLDAIGAVGVARLAVDEAHCLSEWGHDFRPDYLRLADVRERLGSPPTIALTATATEPGQRRTSSRRCGCATRSCRAPGSTAPTSPSRSCRWRATTPSRRCSCGCCRRPGALPAVVYCGRRRTCEEVAEALAAGGIRAAAYHAGLAGGAPHGDARRGSWPASWTWSRRRPRSGWASTRPDVRSVVHWSLPASPEEYYQQAGRAGRDGEPGPVHAALQPARQGPDRLLHQPGEARRRRPRGRAPRAWPSAADAGGVFRVAERDVPVRGAARGGGRARAGGCARALPGADGHVRGPARRRAASRAAHLAAAMVASKRVERQRWDRLKAIDAYATADGCRREALLGYFGDRPAEPLPDPCCDRCGVGARAGRRDRRPRAGRPARPRPASADVEAAVLQAVDDTGGAVGRTRLSQILRGSSGRALRAAGHDALPSYGALAGMTDQRRARPHRPHDRRGHAREDRRASTRSCGGRRPARGERGDGPRRRPARPDRRPRPPPRPRGRAVPRPRAGRGGARRPARARGGGARRDRRRARPARRSTAALDDSSADVRRAAAAALALLGTAHAGS